MKGSEAMEKMSMSTQLGLSPQITALHPHTHTCSYTDTSIWPITPQTTVISTSKAFLAWKTCQLATHLGGAFSHSPSTHQRLQALYLPTICAPTWHPLLHPCSFSAAFNGNECVYKRALVSLPTQCLWGDVGEVQITMCCYENGTCNTICCIALWNIM